MPGPIGTVCLVLIQCNWFTRIQRPTPPSIGLRATGKGKEGAQLRPAKQTNDNWSVIELLGPRVRAVRAEAVTGWGKAWIRKLLSLSLAYCVTQLIRARQVVFLFYRMIFQI